MLSISPYAVSFCLSTCAIYDSIKTLKLINDKLLGCSQITTVNLNPGFDPPRRLLLQYLDLTDCCSINDEGLKTIVVNCPQLVYLYLRRCVQITGECRI